MHSLPLLCSPLPLNDASEDAPSPNLQQLQQARWQALHHLGVVESPLRPPALVTGAVAPAEVS
jgi:hypothetical protein